MVVSYRRAERLSALLLMLQGTGCYTRPQRLSTEEKILKIKCFIYRRMTLKMLKNTSNKRIASYPAGI